MVVLQLAYLALAAMVDTTPAVTAWPDPHADNIVTADSDSLGSYMICDGNDFIYAYASGARYDRVQPCENNGPHPIPVWTADVLTRMTKFWTSLIAQFPIKTAGASYPGDSFKKNHNNPTTYTMIIGKKIQKGLIGPIDMVDAARSEPLVAKYLQQAGLTAPQWEGYIIALYNAYYTRMGKLEPTSIQKQNIAFLNAYEKELSVWIYDYHP
jgi:hypothetical protein